MNFTLFLLATHNLRYALAPGPIHGNLKTSQIGGFKVAVRVDGVFPGTDGIHQVVAKLKSNRWMDMTQSPLPLPDFFFF